MSDSQTTDFSNFEEDEKLEWWQPSKRDNYNLTNKLFRTGCRPIKRKYLTCKRDADSSFDNCQNFKEDLEKCMKIVKFIYAAKN